MDQNDALLGYALAALSAAGGLMGFIRKRSLPSLVAGGVSGAAIAATVSHAQRTADKQPAIVVTAALAALMGVRFFRSGWKFMPSGLVFTLSTATALKFAGRI